MVKSKKIRVRFAVDDDEQANKISALLEALGYDAVRELDHGSAQNRMRWAVTRLTTKAKLTERERDILARVLHGQLNAEIGEELGISKATVKWHMHNIFTKTGAATREALLREALQLGGVSRRPSATKKTADAKPDTAAVESGAADSAAVEGGTADTAAVESGTADTAAVESGAADSGEGAAK